MKTGPAIAALTLLGVCFLAALYAALAYVHDGVYFLFLGREFAGLASLSDTLSYSVIWLPFVAITAAVALPVWVRPLERSAERPDPHRYDSVLAVGMGILGPLLMISAGVAVALYGIGATYPVVAAMMGWIALQGLLFTPARAKALGSATVRQQVILSTTMAALMLTVGAALVGYADSAEDMVRGRQVNFELTSDVAATARRANMVRTLSGGVLIRQGRDIRFVPWDSVSSLQVERGEWRSRPSQERSI